MLCVIHGVAGCFSVKALGAPQPTPYLAGKTAADLLAGTNFAVGGATALEPAVLARMGIVSAVPVSLSNETRWFQDALQLLASSINGKSDGRRSCSFFLKKKKMMCLLGSDFSSCCYR